MQQVKVMLKGPNHNITCYLKWHTINYYTRCNPLLSLAERCTLGLFSPTNTFQERCQSMNFSHACKGTRKFQIFHRQSLSDTQESCIKQLQQCKFQTLSRKSRSSKWHLLTSEVLKQRQNSIKLISNFVVCDGGRELASLLHCHIYMLLAMRPENIKEPAGFSICGKVAQTALDNFKEEKEACLELLNFFFKMGIHTFYSQIP